MFPGPHRQQHNPKAWKIGLRIQKLDWGTFDETSQTFANYFSALCDQKVIFMLSSFTAKAVSWGWNIRWSYRKDLLLVTFFVCVWIWLCVKFLNLILAISIAKNNITTWGFCCLKLFICTVFFFSFLKCHEIWNFSTTRCSSHPHQKAKHFILGWLLKIIIC